MGAVGSGARHDLGWPSRRSAGIATLNRVGDRLDTVDQRPLVARFEADKNRGDTPAAMASPIARATAAVSARRGVTR